MIRILDENNILYPKRFLITNVIKKVKYQICVTKPTEETDTFRILRDDYGKLYTEKPLGDWTILTSEDYDVEDRDEEVEEIQEGTKRVLH